jgi:hypothetical protein
MLRTPAISSAPLAKEPNRFIAVAGAAKATEALGDKAKAKSYYQRLVALGTGGNIDWPELFAARESFSKNAWCWPIVLQNYFHGQNKQH